MQLMCMINHSLARASHKIAKKTHKYTLHYYKPADENICNVHLFMHVFERVHSQVFK